MFGQLSSEASADVSADVAWQLFSTLELGKVAQEGLPHILEKVEVVEGDGGVGTVLQLTFPPPPGSQKSSSYKEKFTKIDHEKRVKETEIVEGGFLELGFTLYRAGFEIVEKDENSCIIKSKIEYDVKEEAASNVSMVSIQPLEAVADVAISYLTKMKNADATAP